MNPEEVFGLLVQAKERGELKSKQDVTRWLADRGFDEYGKPTGPGLPFGRGLSSGVMQRGILGTGERLSRAFGLEEAAAKFRRGAASAAELEQERGLLGTAPAPLNIFDRAPRSEAESRTFSGGEMAGAFGTEIAKAYGAGKAGAALGRTAAGQRVGAQAARAIAKAPGGRIVAKVAGRLNPYSLAAINALQAIEDVGSLPEESTAGQLAQLARLGEPGPFRQALASALEAASETAPGRALAGATVGAIPEIAGLFLSQAPKAVRQVAVPAAAGAGAGALVGDERAATLGGLAGGMLGVRRALRPVATAAPRQSDVLQQAFGPVPNLDEAGNVIPSYGTFTEGFSAGEEAAGRDISSVGQFLDEVMAGLPEGAPVPAGPTRRRATGVAEAERQAQREAERQVAAFNRDLTGAAAEAFRNEQRRAATRTMLPIEARREAEQIILRRNRENAAATTTQQKAAVERMHAAEDARLEGTPLGEALKVITPAATPSVRTPVPAPAATPAAVPAATPAAAPVVTPVVPPAVPRATQAVVPPPAPRAPAAEMPAPSERAMNRAQAIIALRKKQDAAAKTKRQKETLVRERATQNARMAGTEVGRALERLGVPLAAGAATLGAADAMSEESAVPGAELAGGALLAGAFVPGVGRGMMRTLGRSVNPAAEQFLGKAYSRLESGVLNPRLQERMSGRDWANALRGSVPQSEVEWTGLGRFLDDNAGNTLSRDEVADYLAQNRLEVSEYTLRPEDWEETGEPVFGFFEGRRPREVGGLDATTLVKNRSNYRDVVFTFEPKVKGVEYEGPHYRAPNVMMGVRMFDAELPDGQRALFVQEIQSDLHQGARRAGGARSTEMDEALMAHRRASTETYRAAPGPEREAAQANLQRLSAEFEQRFGMSIAEARKRPTQAPFAKTEEWTELGLKRALDEAVAGGYDRLVLANWPQTTVGGTRRFILDDVAGVRVYPSTKSIEPFRVSPRGKVQEVSAVRGGGPVQVERAEDALKFVEDPAVAQRIADALNGGEAVTIRFDAPVTFGDRTLKAFYDEKIPSILKKYLGSMGLKAELRPVQLQVSSAEMGRLRTQPSLALDITPELKTKVSAGQRLLAPTLMAAGAGAAAGAATDEEGRPKQAGIEPGFNLPTLLALGIGGAVVRSRFNAARAAGAAERAAKVDLGRIAQEATAYTEGVARTTRTAEKTARAAERIRRPVGPRPADAFTEPRTPTDVFRFVNRLTSDPDMARELAETTDEVIASGRVNMGGRISWETEREVAKAIGINAEDLALKDPSKQLTGPEFLALSEVYGRNVRRRNLVKQVMDDPMETEGNRQLAKQLYAVLDERVVNAFQRLTRERSEAGRVLNLMKAARASSTDPNDWLYRAQKLAGGRALSPEMAADIIKAVERGEFVKAQMIIGRAKAANTSFLDKAGEFWQTALLSRLSRPFRDLVANATNSADTRAQYVLMSALDRMGNTFKVFPTRVAGGSALSINRAAREGAKKGWEQAFALFRAKEGAELSAETMDALERAARRYDFSDESAFENPLLRSWASFIRRTISASDQPFYEAGFGMSIESQARAMAANAKLTGASAEEYINGLTANPTAEMIATAVEEGADAVFQSQTSLGRIAATAGGRGAKSPLVRFAGKQLIPFAQTPSAITTQAMMQTPLGLLDAAPDVIAAAAGQTAAQRKLLKKVAAMGTGAGWLWAGYTLADEDKLSGFYPDDPNERARWQEEGKQPSALLIGGKWYSLLGFLGPQASLMVMGGLMRRYMEEDLRGALESLGLASVVGAAEGLIESPAMQGVSSMIDLAKAVKMQDEERMNEALGRAAESQVTGWVPGILQQIAAAQDVDPSGRVIMRDPMAGETLSEDIMNALRLGIPGQREMLPAKVSPFGRTRTSGAGGLEGILSPLRTSQSYATPLTQALEEVGYFPVPSRRDRQAGETTEAYGIRRQAEGPQEEAFLAALFANDPRAMEFVSDQSIEDYNQTGDAAELVRRALTNFRSTRSRANRER